MTKRESKPVKEKITDNAQLEEVLGEYASADARIAEINAKIDQQVIKIREQQAEQLQKLTEKRDLCFDRIQDYAEDNAKMFVAKRSVDLSHGTIGFRTGTPKLKLVSKRFTWASVTELLSDKLPAYVRKIMEPAKDKIIADRDKIDVEKLEKCGITIDQEEKFFIELKKEETTQANG
jgi:phage host-nuclease inhibitor protein Gam